MLPYDPGPIPTKPAPEAGESVEMTLQGLPPYKDVNASMRNSKHKINSRFVTLRKAAAEAMDRRACYRGAIALDVEIHSTEFDPGKVLLDYVSGIMDTLDGSAGKNFTYLPIAYQDDCQVCAGTSHWLRGDAPWYKVKVTFLSPDTSTRDLHHHRNDAIFSQMFSKPTPEQRKAKSAAPLKSKH